MIRTVTVLCNSVGEDTLEQTVKLRFGNLFLNVEVPNQSSQCLLPSALI